MRKKDLKMHKLGELCWWRRLGVEVKTTLVRKEEMNVCGGVCPVPVATAEEVFFFLSARHAKANYLCALHSAPTSYPEPEFQRHFRLVLLHPPAETGSA